VRVPERTRNEIRAVLHHADQDVSSARRLNQNVILPPGGLRLKFSFNFPKQNPAQPSRHFRHHAAKLYFATCENGSVELFPA